MSVVNSTTFIVEGLSLGVDSKFLETQLAEGCPENNVDPIPPATKPRRQRRWRFLLRRKRKDCDGPSIGARVNCQGPSIACGCRGAVKGSYVIVIASFIELLVSLVCLLYGLFYIQSAYDFYKLDNGPEKRGQAYDKKLEQIHFLGKHTVGFVGLLATCTIGIIISFLMPIGTIYKSWKSLRAALTLLFSVCLVHIVLLAFFLPRTELLASIVAIPFRGYEFFIILNYIKYYKRRKFEELRERMKQADCKGNSTSTLMGNQNVDA